MSGPILLCGDVGAAELALWREALYAALPGRTLLTERDPAADRAIEIALVANPAAGALQGLPRLRLIQSLWAGVDRLLADASVPPGVPIARMVDPLMSAAMAETALWAVLALQRDFFAYARAQQRGEWQPLPQRRAEEWPVLVLGLGQIGAGVARRLAGNGYPVTGWSGRPHAGIDGVRCISGEPALREALGAASVVVNLLPLTAATRGVLDARCFAAMRPGTHLVNLARGAHLVEADALAALAAGRLGELVLDVFTTEPLPAGHPFWSHPRVTVLPHVAAQTDRRSAAAIAAANIARAESGVEPLYLVDRARGY